MADSIDEFFAKKDKSKKGKSKAKYTTSETIAKKLEEGGKKPEPVPKKDNNKLQINLNSQSIIIPSLPNDQEDDEWKDIEETERDYSGLKIQALSISEKEKEEEQLKEQMLSEQNGDSIKQGDGQTGPWKNVQKPQEIQCTEDEEEPQVKEEPPKAAGTYKPPALRNASTASVSHKRYSKNAPPPSSEFDFPSLSSAASESYKWKMSEADNKNFQSVKHGVRSKGESQKEVQLDLENKFSALHQEK